MYIPRIKEVLDVAATPLQTNAGRYRGGAS
jgi:hypothetical protein